MPTPSTTAAVVSASPLRAGEPLDDDSFHRIRRRMLLDFCKWDSQVGDVTTLSRFPLFISRSGLRELFSLSTKLAAETAAAERELLARPDLHRLLGMPRRLRGLLARSDAIEPTPAVARMMRFDFHWTPQGWRISEVNSDVPGGFCESSNLPELMAALHTRCVPAGNPGESWARGVVDAVEPMSSVALLAAPGFLEDQQIVAYLSRLLQERGLRTHRVQPHQLEWRDGRARLQGDPTGSPLGAVVRFYQAEWHGREASPLFLGGRTLVCNPGTAALTESKRFPLVWSRLKTPLPTWRQCLPTTLDPRDCDWRHDDRWLLKSAYCNTGDTVTIRSLLSPAKWRRALRTLRWSPGSWVAQERFAIVPVPSCDGPVYPCIGLYVINGEPAGIYGRYSRSALIDYAAVDAAVLVDSEEEGG